MEIRNLAKEQMQTLRKADVMAMLPSNEQMEELVRSRSQLYTSYSVKDKEGKYRSVVDIDSVVELLRELLKNEPAEKSESLSCETCIFDCEIWEPTHPCADCCDFDKHKSK